MGDEDLDEHPNTPKSRKKRSSKSRREEDFCSRASTKKYKCEKCGKYDDVQHHHYSDETVGHIKTIYVIAIILWGLLIWACHLYLTDLIGWIFLAAPLFVFSINISNLGKCTKEVEGEMFEGNFLSFAFLTAVILINWDKTSDKSKLFKLLIVALVLIMLSLVDFWLPLDQIVLAKHFRSILQTFALFLLAFTLYKYYLDVVVKSG